MSLIPRKKQPDVLSLFLDLFQEQEIIDAATSGADEACEVNCKLLRFLSMEPDKLLGVMQAT